MPVKKRQDEVADPREPAGRRQHGEPAERRHSGEPAGKRHSQLVVVLKLAHHGSTRHYSWRREFVDF